MIARARWSRKQRNCCLLPLRGGIIVILVRSDWRRSRKLFALMYEPASSNNVLPHRVMYTWLSGLGDVLGCFRLLMYYRCIMDVLSMYCGCIIDVKMCYQCITQDRRFIISNQPNLVGPRQPSKGSMRGCVLFCK